jgi:hypothetical protein
MGRLRAELRGLVVVLAMAGPVGGAFACGGLANRDKVGVDSDGPDGMGDSPGDIAPEASTAIEDATLDSSEDAVPGDVSIDTSLDAVAEGADAGGPDVLPDSIGDVALEDVAVDAPAGADAEHAGLGDTGSDAPSCPAEADPGAEPPSCALGGPGMTNCGPGGTGTESCCTSLEVCGGTFSRLYDNDGGGPTGRPNLRRSPAFASTNTS